MKIHKSSLIAILAMSGLIAFSAGLTAQDTNSAAAPRQGGGGGRGGGFGGGTVDERLARLTEQLTLTDEQKPKVKAVLEDQTQKRAGLRDLAPEDRRAKNQALQEEVGKKLKEILTEEQYKKYEALPRGGRGQGGQGGQGDGARRERPGAGGTNAPARTP